MVKPFATVLLGLGLAAGPACGRKGPLVLPPGRAPMPVEALTATPGPEAVLLRWSNPVKTVAGRPVGPIEAIEVWVFDKGLPPGVGQALAAGAVEKSARLLRRIARREFVSFASASGGSPGVLSYTHALAPGPSGPIKLAFTLRVFDGKGRASEFAPPVVVDIVRKAPQTDRPAPEGAS